MFGDGGIIVWLICKILFNYIKYIFIGFNREWFLCVL